MLKGTTYAAVLATALAASTAQATLIDSFEDGDFTSSPTWTLSGSWHVGGPGGGQNVWITATNLDGTRWADSSVSGDGDTGTLTSPVFTIDSNLVQFKMSGLVDFVQQVGPSTNLRWELVRSSDNVVLSRGLPPNLDGPHRDMYIATDSLIGENVYMRFVDDSSGRWLSVDELKTGSRSDTSVFSFELHQQSLFTPTGSFGFYANGHPWTPSGHSREGGEFLRSADANSSSMNTPNFTITRDTLELFTAGFGINEGGAGPNGSTLELRRASDNSVLHTWGDDEVLGGDSFIARSLNVSSWAFENVYLRLNDNLNGGYGWVGVDDVRLSGAAVPEPGLLSLLGLGGLALLRRRH